MRRNSCSAELDCFASFFKSWSLNQQDRFLYTSRVASPSKPIISSNITAAALKNCTLYVLKQCKSDKKGVYFTTYCAKNASLYLDQLLFYAMICPQHIFYLPQKRPVSIGGGLFAFGYILGTLLQHPTAVCGSLHPPKTAENLVYYPYFLNWGCRGFGFESRRSDHLK